MNEIKSSNAISNIVILVLTFVESISDVSCMPPNKNICFCLQNILKVDSLLYSYIIKTSYLIKRERFQNIIGLRKIF